MTAVVRHVAIVGRDARADALFAFVQPEHVSPRAQVRVVGWWAGGALPAAAAPLAAGSLADLLATPGLDLVLLCGAEARDPAAVRAVAASGIEAVAFAPVAGDPDDVAKLRVTTELRASLAGAQGFEALARGDVGEVLAAYVGVRVPADASDAAGGALRRWLAAALDLACAATGALPVRTYARSGRLLGGERDHLQLLLRFADDAIATLDLLELPAGSAVAEVDVEVTGREGLLRLKPLAHQVVATSFAAPGATERRGWHPEAVRVLVDDLLSVPAADSRVAPLGSAALARWTTDLEARLAEADEVVFAS